MTDPVVAAAADNYMAQPLNPKYTTPDDEKVRKCGYDAFIAGAAWRLGRRNHDGIYDATEAYLSRSSQPGNHILRMEMFDAFLAGVAWIETNSDEYQRLRKEWP